MSTVTRIQYNGIDIYDGSGYTITSFEENTPVRISEDLLTGQHGGKIWAEKFAMKDIAIEGVIWGGTVSDYFTLKNSLIEAFNIINVSSNLLTVKLWNGSEKSIYADVVTTPIIKEVTGRQEYNNFRVELRAEDPFWLGTSTVTGDCTLSVAGGTPVGSPVGSPILVAFGNVIILTNNGDTEVYPTYTIRNAVTDPTIYNATTGETMSVTVTMVDGDELIIGRNNAGEYVTLNGTNYYSYFNGIVEPAVVGQNYYQFSASGYSATATLDIEFTEKYLSI